MEFEQKDYKVFEMFNKDWALVTAGNKSDYNSCTVSWGSLGNIWNHVGKNRPIVTVYIHPARYTGELLKKYDMFTVSFYGKEYKRALVYMGSHSGYNENKVMGAGLTPVAVGEGITYEEAKLTLLCRKLYMHQFTKDDLADEIKEYYAEQPKVYPNVTPDGTEDDWEPHYMIIGEIIETREFMK
ncbi:flavin reductase [Peptoniphilus sp. oral taxon 386]|uniref:flavin reductase n=1 Tax=Peptoniphilus sp. oral taxon 386 TaxID=652713 RepID=UPI0002E0AAB3|nr:flavin reductase [Peptoniphilus sp. oral taxon 386]